MRQRGGVKRMAKKQKGRRQGGKRRLSNTQNVLSALKSHPAVYKDKIYTQPMMSIPRQFVCTCAVSTSNCKLFHKKCVVKLDWRTGLTGHIEPVHA